MLCFDQYPDPLVRPFPTASFRQLTSLKHLSLHYTAGIDFPASGSMRASDDDDGICCVW